MEREVVLDEINRPFLPSTERVLHRNQVSVSCEVAFFFNHAEREDSRRVTGSASSRVSGCRKPTLLVFHPTFFKAELRVSLAERSATQRRVVFFVASKNVVNDLKVVG